MIKIEHAALYVRDLEGMRDFYTLYFDGVANDGYHNVKTGLRTYFITFGETGARLELMTRPETQASASGEYDAGYAHLAFTVGDRAAVDALTQTLANAGCTVAGAPRVTGDGYYEACILDPEGNRVELVAER